jgi:ssDNA-binding replication factor A large subunit
MSPEEPLESRIEQLRAEFGNTFDEATLRRIALDERGQHMANDKKIAELKDREEVTIVVKVTKINDTRTFKKRDSGEGRVRNLSVEDETGNCRLALWDEDTELPEKAGIAVGTMLKCTNCYTKQTDYGLDISKGKKGKIELAT